MPRGKTMKKNNIAAEDLEIKSEADIPKLIKLLNKKHPIIFAYIGAEEWCGPCQKFRPLYEEYKKTLGRNIPMVHIDHKLIPKTFASKAKINGFPSGTIYSPKDKSFASFKDENGEETNAVPTIRDKEAMTSFLKANPKELLKANNNMVSANANDGADSQSLVRTATTRQRLVESGKKAIKNRNDPLPETPGPSPPNLESDTIQPMNMPPKENQAPAKGGSLFQTLLRVARGFGAQTRRASVDKRRTRKR
jgi:thiol-disulfide isomerase/thioredoxin